MACGRLGGWMIAVAIASACGLEEQGLAPTNAAGGASGATLTGGVGPTGGAWSGGSSSDGPNDSGGLAGADGSMTGGSAGAANAGGAAGVATGGAAGAAGSTGGSAGAPPKDCATVFAGVQNVSVCPDPPVGQCKLAFGGTLGVFLSCFDVCTSVGAICLGALDDEANQSCVLPAVPAPLDCTYKPNKAVCFCSKP